MGKKILTLATVALVAVTTYRVYDAQGRLTEIWRDRGDLIEVYGPQMERKGHIRKEADRWSRFDKEMNRIATIEKGDKGPVTLDWIEE